MAYLHRATPGFNASSKSPGGNFSRRTSSIQARTSFAACGVYLDRRILRKSLSSEGTDAMMTIIACAKRYKYEFSQTEADMLNRSTEVTFYVDRRKNEC